jgi:hypothetical protein
MVNFECSLILISVLIDHYSDEKEFSNITRVWFIDLDRALWNFGAIDDGL